MANKESVLITGAAGFIGFHLSQRLLRDGFEVIGIDNLNDYYDVNLKKGRLDILQKLPSFTFHKIDIADSAELNSLFGSNNIKYVVNLAAQAGVRYSLENPQAYVSSNITGFVNVLEGCRHHGIDHLVFASSSSVYGANTTQPFAVEHNVDHPVSLYAASKKANELMAHSYASNFGVPVTGLRFFTVYGPWGRPDMALFLFTKAILEGRPIDVFNNGDMKRDFTYIDDIVEGIARIMVLPAAKNEQWDGGNPDPSTSFAPYRVCNIGSNSPSSLMRFIEIIEKEVGLKAKKNLLPMQIGDVPSTFADVSSLKQLTGFEPSTSLTEGISSFVKWYKEYYRV